MSEIQYWDVFPKSIKVSKVDTPVSVPLTARGTLRGTAIFESSNPGVATVSAEGLVSLGTALGGSEITVYDSEDKDSIRFVGVEVVDYGKSDIQVS